MKLDTHRPFQLDGSLLVLWGPRPSARGAHAPGLVTVASVCSNPKCLCTDVGLYAIEIDDRAAAATYAENTVQVSWSTEDDAPRPTRKVSLTLDTFTGHVDFHSDTPDDERHEDLLAIARHAVSGALLDALHERRLRVRNGEPKVSFRDEDWSVWEPGDMVSRLNTFPMVRHDRYLLGRRTFQADEMFCADPRCSCTQARVLFFEVKPGPDEITLTEVGSLAFDVGTGRASDFLTSGIAGDELRQLWAAYVSRHAPVLTTMTRYRQEVRRVGAELYTTRTSAAAPAGPSRNGPCPCGSGKKYKRCCAAGRASA